MVKPLYVNSMFLRPLPPSMWDTACSQCDKRQSRWAYVPIGDPIPAGDAPLCSLCWLYESDWASDKRPEVDALIRAVERKRGKIFQRGRNQKLWSCKDADSILGAVVMTSRMVELHAKAHR